MRAALLLLAFALAFAPGARAGDAIRLRVIAVNDFHGHLEPESGEGGAVALASTLAALREGQAHTLFVSSGDLIGASPLPSALAHDEPTLQLFKHLDLQANTVGNHELDGGLAELRRQEALAGFPFLSANLVDAVTGKPAFAPYRIVDVDGLRVAFVGATVRNALKPLEPDSVPDLRLDDEAEALNAQAHVLQTQGVHVLVALLHEGAGAQDAVVPAAGCDSLTGRAREITQALDPAFALVLSAHTHARYACRVGGRWLLQGGSYGRYLGVADLRIAKGKALVVDARNEPVRLLPGESPDPKAAALVDQAVAAASKIADAPIAVIPGGRISAAPDNEGGSPLGRLVARAQLAAGAARGAQLACTNPSSVPRDLVATLSDDTASYADVRAVQPYGNRLKLRRVNGAQLRALLGQQGREGGRVSLSCYPKLEKPLADADEVVMVVNSYLARGGQGFSALVGTPEIGEAGKDLDALLAWLRAHPAGK